MNQPNMRGGSPTSQDDLDGIEAIRPAEARDASQGRRDCRLRQEQERPVARRQLSNWGRREFREGVVGALLVEDDGAAQDTDEDRSASGSSRNPHRRPASSGWRGRPPCRNTGSAVSVEVQLCNEFVVVDARWVTPLFDNRASSLRHCSEQLPREASAERQESTKGCNGGSRVRSGDAYI